MWRRDGTSVIREFNNHGLVVLINVIRRQERPGMKF